MKKTLALLLCLSNPVLAAVRVDVDMNLNSERQSHAVFISGSQLKIVNQSNPGVDIHYNADTRALHAINHDERTYMVITEQKVDELSQLASSLASLAQVEGGVLGDLFTTLGVAVPSVKAEISVQRTGESLLVAGVSCAEVNVYKDNSLETTLCMADTLPGAKVEGETLKQMMMFSQKLASKAGGFLTKLNIAVPVMPEVDVAGVPMRMSSETNNLTSEVVRVQQIDLPDSVFELPPTYQQTVLPL